MLYRNLPPKTVVKYRGMTRICKAKIIEPCKEVHHTGIPSDYIYTAKRIDARRPSLNRSFSLRANLIVGVIHEA